MNKPGPLLTLVTVIVLTLVWGTTWAAIRIGLESLAPFTGASFRFLTGSLALLVISRVLGIRHGTTRTERRLWLGVALLSFVGSYAIVYWAEQWIPSGLAAVLFATFPLFIAVLAHFFLPGDRFTVWSLTGILTGFAGVAIIYSEDLRVLGGENAVLTSLVMLASPLLAAVNQTCVKRWGKGIHPFSLTAVPMGIAAGVLGAMAVLFEHDRSMTFDAGAVGSVLYLGLGGTALTFSLYYWQLSHYPSSRLSLVAFGTPVVAVSVGALFLGEEYTARTLVGSVLVLVGVALATGPGAQRRIVA